MLVVSREKACILACALLRIVFAEMSLIAAKDIIGIIDQEAQNEVVNAHLDKVEIETCTWIEQENCLSYFWLFRAHSVKYINGNSVYRRLAARADERQRAICHCGRIISKFIGSPVNLRSF